MRRDSTPSPGRYRLDAIASVPVAGGSSLDPRERPTPTGDLTGDVADATPGLSTASSEVEAIEDEAEWRDE